MQMVLKNIHLPLGEDDIVAFGRKKPCCFISTEHYLFVIENIFTKQPELICPNMKWKPCKRGMLSVSNDRKLLMLAGSKRNSFYVLDSRNGVIKANVQDKELLANFQAMQCIPRITSGTVRPSFLAVSPGAVMRGSTRRGKVTKQGRIYLSRPNFNFVAVADSGTVVLGSKKGDLKIVDRVQC